MATIVVIPQPIRADVDEEAVPHIFAPVTAEPFDEPVWNDAGELEVTFPTVDLSPEQIDEVIRLARLEPAIADLGTAEQLPPQIIPEEGVTQYSQAVFDEAQITHLQGDIAVIGRLFVARYASGAEGETSPAPGSNVVEIDSSEGADLFSAKTPTGEMSPEGEPLYSPLVTIPQSAFDENGNRIPAVFNGNIITDAATILRALTLQGDATQGERSHVAPLAELQLDNAIGDPDTEPMVDFGPRSRRWPQVGGGEREVGWGVSGAFVVQGRVDGNAVHARFINPSTGLVDHTVQLAGFYQTVAGFTATGNVIYVLGRVTGSSPWFINEYDASTGASTGADVGVDALMRDGSGQSRPNKGALGVDASGIALLMAYTANDGVSLRWRAWVAGSTGAGHTNDVGTNVDTSKSLRGITSAPGAGFVTVCAGNEVFWLGGTNGDTNDTLRHWWSHAGTLTGFGLLPGTTGEYAGTNGGGRLTLYNSQRETDNAILYASWTKRDSVSGKETRQGPVAARAWPARTYATIQTGSPVGGGYDDTEIYASSAGPARTQMWKVGGIPVGQTQATIATAPTSGTNPPAVNGFADGQGTEPGRIRSEVVDSSGDPVTHLDGDGTFVAKKLMQTGQQNVNIVAPLGTLCTEHVVFEVPFDAEPRVMLTVEGTTTNAVSPPVALNITPTEFDLQISRIAGDATKDIVVQWAALARTQ